MQRTRPNQVPVITLLSRSPSLSRRTLKALQNLTPGVQPLHLERKHDILDDALRNPISSDLKFVSTAARCVTTNTVFHCVSLTASSTCSSGSSHTGDESEVENTRSTGESKSLSHGANHLSLLSITGGGCDSAQDSVSQAREILAREIKSPTLLGMKLAFQKAMTGRIEPGDIFCCDLPILCLPNSNGNGKMEMQKTSEEQEGLEGYPFVREIVVPHNYHHGSTIQSKLSASTLERPQVGLYSWEKDGLVIRPLPSAAEDRVLSPPSIIFQCSDLQSVVECCSKPDCSITDLAKIGFSGGDDNGGQIMIGSPYFQGIDLRFCSAKMLSSAFAEAQDALLAGSLSELQSDNVLSDGGDVHLDLAKGNDCWFEFRVNLKNPGGFLKGARSQGRSATATVRPHKASRRVAKAPNIPFE